MHVKGLARAGRGLAGATLSVRPADEAVGRAGVAAEAHRWWKQSSLFLRGALVVLLKPSTDWTRPTHTVAQPALLSV